MIAAKSIGRISFRLVLDFMIRSPFEKRQLDRPSFRRAIQIAVLELALRAINADRMPVADEAKENNDLRRQITGGLPLRLSDRPLKDQASEAARPQPLATVPLQGSVRPRKTVKTGPGRGPRQLGIEKPQV